MSEKTKGRSHPFAGVLYPTEEVLWMGEQGRLPFLSTAKAFLGFLCLPLIVPAIYYLDQALTSASFSILWYIIIGVGAPCLSVLGLVFTVWTFISPAKIYYALTTERVLQREANEVASLPLDEVEVINIVNDDEKRPSLSFGPFFPIWANIKEPDTLKRLIEKARAKRRQESQS